MSTPQETPPPSTRFLDATIRPPAALDIVLALVACLFLWMVNKAIFGTQSTPSALWVGMGLGLGFAVVGISPRAAPKAFAAVVGAIVVVGAITVSILGAAQ
jgi:hypothetical protein